MMLRQSSEKISTGVSILAYSSCSISMVLANKMLLSQYKFEFPIMLLFLQNIVAVVMVEAAKHCVPAVKYDGFKTEVAIEWLPVNMCFIAMLMTGFLSLKNLSVPMVTIFKNLTNVIILFGDWYLQGAIVTRGTIGAILLMVSGAVLAARNDLHFNAAGYAWMALNCMSTAAYVLYMANKSKHMKLSKWGMVFYNNLLSLPILLPTALVFGELPRMLSDPLLADPGFLAMAFFSGGVGFLLNLCALWCVGATSATTYAVVGALNKVPLIFLGAAIFHAVVTQQQWIYIVASMCGGFLYSYCEFHKPKKAVLPSPSLAK